MRPCTHFIAFKGEEYWSAVRIWGRPDFIHIGWDRRAQLEICPGDTVIFARGTDADPIPQFNFADILEKEH